MKPELSIHKILLFSVIVSFLLTTGYSQECGYVTNYNEGDSWVIASTPKRGDKTTTVYEVKSKSQSGDTSIITIEAQPEDNEEEIIFEYDIKCFNGEIYMDMQRFFSNMKEQFKGKGMDVKMESSDIVFPNDLSVGDQLDGGNMNMKLSMPGNNFDINIIIKDRKVIKKEEVTTPAGTYNCFVIQQTSELKGKMINNTSKSKTWYNPSVGMIKNESFTKNGKKSGSSEMIELNR